jgi:[acyl-carrier-protein] S-malonyltransferase
MRPAAQELAAALARVTLRSPRFSVVSNVDAGTSADPAQIKERLAAQVCAPVLWEDSMRFALAQGLLRFLEPGPGKVLAGLLGKIEPNAVVRAAAAPSDLDVGEPEAVRGPK